MSFTLPDNDETANEVISKVLCFQFRSVDVVKFANEYSQIHSLPPEETRNESTDPPKRPRQEIMEEAKEIIDTESFIRSLQVSYVSDTEVIIKVGNNKTKSYTCGKMGFKSAENGWKLLMEVLKDRDHFFRVGPYSKDRIPEKNKRYNQRQKWIPQFNKKFAAFINREWEYGVQIPDKMKLFENQKKNNRDGLYKPMFLVDSNDAINRPDIKKMSKQAVLEEMEKLVNDRKRVKTDAVREDLLSRISDYATCAYKNGWINQEQLQIMISLPDENPSGEDAMSLVEQEEDINKF